MSLDAIIAAKKAAHAKRPTGHLEALRRRIVSADDIPEVRSVATMFENRRRPRVIAELKRRAPWMHTGSTASLATLASELAEAGAIALAVVTEPVKYEGSLADLATAREAAPRVPILCRDFPLFPEDIYEMRQAGADAVSVVVSILDDAVLGKLVAAARALGMDALVEVHSERELDRALAVGARFIGVNHRDLESHAVDLPLAARLAPRFPAETIRIAVGGLRSTADFVEMRGLGYHGVLVGDTVMRAPSPGAALRAFLEGAAAR